MAVKKTTTKALHCSTGTDGNAHGAITLQLVRVLSKFLLASPNQHETVCILNRPIETITKQSAFLTDKDSLKSDVQKVITALRNTHIGILVRPL